MKTVCALLFLSIFISLNSKTLADENELKEITLEGEEYSLDAVTESAIIKQNNQRQVDVYNLQKAKFKMVSGDLRLAEFFLNRIPEESPVASVKKRYLATLYFILGRFDQSIKELEDKKVNNNNYFVQTCLLKLVNYMAVGNVAGIEREKKFCQSQTARYSKNDQFWLDSMILLKTNNTQGLRKNLLTDVEFTMNDDEMSKLWLKTGLYLNKEKDLLNLIAFLPETSYQSKRLREIIAFMYLRSGEKARALSFVDDIDTANAENIKGNINLANKEYELAFGHFRLALQKKQDSSNALERAIPLSWILGQWSDGLSMLNNLSNHTQDQRNTAAVKIAFLIREQNFEEAKRELTLLKIAFQNEPPVEVSVMDSYVTLILGEKNSSFDKRRLEEMSERACRAFDGINCWVSLQHIQWENLGRTIKRIDSTFSDNHLSLASLKEKVAITPLEESKNIDQNDIEELDGQSIRLRLSPNSL